MLKPISKQLVWPQEPHFVQALMWRCLIDNIFLSIKVYTVFVDNEYGTHDHRLMKRP